MGPRFREDDIGVCDESELRRRHVREHRLDLGLQRGGIERLDDIVVHAGLINPCNGS